LINELHCSVQSRRKKVLVDQAAAAEKSSELEAAETTLEALKHEAREEFRLAERLNQVLCCAAFCCTACGALDVKLLCVLISGYPAAA
jgi:hypothetical protein